ncbi:MAG TPA: lysylphosphatidylglycerol synthase transmembrane domain-containing protein [Polyangiaceae bacterium]|jgi:uncharacterized membrane protein YbhN (UPF0104 family)|nr:lysylphosphatidylglycerol synthase transmembrane domain-containing protein [Polyangiaceae bacterium]
MKRLRPWLRVLGALCLLLLIPHIDLRHSLQLVRALPALPVVLASVAYAANVLLKAWRWHRMQRRQGTPIRWTESLAAFLSGAMYGMLTIGRVGELMRAEVLVRHGQPRVTALTNSIADRILDALFLLATAAISSTLMLPNTERAYLLGLGLFALGFVGLWLARWRNTRPQPASSLVTDTPDPMTSLWKRSLRAADALVGTLLRVLTGDGALEALLWTAISWFGYFVAVALLASALGLHAPFLALVGSTAIGSAAAALPISFQGIGTRETAYAAALAPHGISTTDAITLSVVTLALLYSVVLPLGAVGLLLERNQRRLRSEKLANDGSVNAV